MDRLFALTSYLRYTLFSTHAGGHGIHSPFIYHFIKILLEDDRQYYVFEQIEAIRHSLRMDKRTIQVTDYGAGAKYKTKQRKISSIAKTALIQRRTGELLFKMIDHYQHKTILELGTSFGIGTAYLTAVNSTNKVISIEGCPETYAIAIETKQKLSLNNLTLICDQFDHSLTSVVDSVTNLDLVYFDGNHSYEPTIRYFETCLRKVNCDSVFIFDDIYWSKEMQRAWQYVKAHNKVILTLDIHRYGLVFFRDGMRKQHYEIRI